MLDRDLNAPVRDFTPPPRPTGDVMEGRYARLERLTPAHAEGLHRSFAGHDALWEYMPTGPFMSETEYGDWVRSVATSSDPLFYAIQDRRSGHFAGVASFLRISPEAGSIEVGFITFAPELQRSRAATEAMFRMMEWAFEAGYRRYEWKCNALNMGSRRAAERLGFSYEGIFRQAAVVKGRNRDTAWFAVIDGEWPGLRDAFQAWLDPANFDAFGQQRVRLSDLTAPLRAASDPALSS